MTGKKHFAFRRLVAMLCMALAFMLSGQTYISLMDRIEHAHAHAHFANPMAGGVEQAHHTSSHASSGKHSHHHDGTESAAHRHGHETAAAQDSQKSGADHQHSDATILFLAAQNFVLAECRIAAELCDTRTAKLVSVSPLGPDHPPKTLS